VKEADVVKSEAANWKPKLRLSREQSDDQQALEDEIKFAKKEVDEAAEDAAKLEAATATLAAKEKELAAMLEGFEARGVKLRPQTRLHAGQAYWACDAARMRRKGKPAARCRHRQLQQP
jgi:chromosome segregation ATPase